MKKYLMYLVIISLVLSLFAACADNNAQKPETSVSPVETIQQTAAAEDNSLKYGDTGGLKLPIVNSPLTLKMVVVSDFGGLSDKLVAKELENRTGIKLNVEDIPYAAFTDKIKLIMTSGSLPDLMTFSSYADVNTFALQGAFEPISKYIDELPNFKKLFVEDQKHSWVLKSYSAEDSNIYWFPQIYTTRQVNHGFMYRKDIFDKNNIKPWTNTDEFYQALKKLKEIYPDSVPFTSKTKEGIFRDFAYGWGLRADISSSDCYYDENSKSWKFAPVQPEYKDMLDLIKKLYDEKLLDAEFLTDTAANWTAKMAEKEKSFATFDWIDRTDLFYDQVKDSIPEYNLRYANPIGPVAKIRRLNDVFAQGICVPKGAHCAEAMKLCDYLYSPSGATLTTMGIEGATFAVDSSGKITYPEIKDKPIGIDTLSDKYGMFTVGMYLRADPRSVYFDYSEKVQEAQDMMVNNNKIEQSDPILKLTNEEKDVVNDLAAALDKAAMEFSSKYVLTKSYPDKEWNNFVTNAEKLNYKKLEEVYNAAQKRFDSQ